MCCSCSAVLRLGPDTQAYGNSARQVRRMAAGFLLSSIGQTRSYRNVQHCLSIFHDSLVVLLLLHRLVGCSYRVSWTT